MFVFLKIFSGRFSALFGGFLGKMGGTAWCFDGEFVVLCVVNVVVQQPYLEC